MESKSRLYQWVVIAQEVNVDLEKLKAFELKLFHLGIRLRTEKHDEVLELWVPLKDADVARDLWSGEVTEVHTTYHELYHIFDEELSYKNDSLYEDKYKNTNRKLRRWNGVLMLVILAAILLLFKFTR